MAAPTEPCYVKILLANSEPSTHGTPLTYPIVRDLSAFEGEVEGCSLIGKGDIIIDDGSILMTAASARHRRALLLDGTGCS
jgi:hypothetical protein